MCTHLGDMSSSVMWLWLGLNMSATTETGGCPPILHTGLGRFILLFQPSLLFPDSCFSFQLPDIPLQISRTAFSSTKWVQPVTLCLVLMIMLWLLRSPKFSTTATCFHFLLYTLTDASDVFTPANGWGWPLQCQCCHPVNAASSCSSKPGDWGCCSI